MKNIFILLMLYCVSCISCGDSLDIKQDYSFTVKTLPLPKRIQKKETVALEFTLTRDGIYKNAVYSFRYFQPDGNGILTDDVGNILQMNRLYPVKNDQFTLLYQSTCEDAQQLDFVFVDGAGQQVEYSISLQNESLK